MKNPQSFLRHLNNPLNNESLNPFKEMKIVPKKTEVLKIMLFMTLLSSLYHVGVRAASTQENQALCTFAKLNPNLNLYGWNCSLDACDWSTQVSCKDGHVTGIDFSSDNVTSTIPTQIGQLTHLTTIIFQYTVTGTIPTQISLLTNLQYLKLTTPVSGTIPTQIGLLTHLTTIILSQTQLSGTIPTQLSLITNLQYLDLKNSNFCGCTTLSPTSYCDLTSLTYECEEDCIIYSKCSSKKCVDTKVNSKDTHLSSPIIQARQYIIRSVEATPAIPNNINIKNTPYPSPNIESIPQPIPNIQATPQPSPNTQATHQPINNIQIILGIRQPLPSTQVTPQPIPNTLATHQPSPNTQATPQPITSSKTFPPNFGESSPQYILNRGSPQPSSYSRVTHIEATPQPSPNIKTTSHPSPNIEDTPQPSPNIEDTPQPSPNIKIISLSIPSIQPDPQSSSNVGCKGNYGALFTCNNTKWTSTTDVILNGTSILNSNFDLSSIFVYENVLLSESSIYINNDLILQKQSVLTLQNCSIFVNGNLYVHPQSTIIMNINANSNNSILSINQAAFLDGSLIVTVHQSQSEKRLLLLTSKSINGTFSNVTVNFKESYQCITSHLEYMTDSVSVYFNFRQCNSATPFWIYVIIGIASTVMLFGFVAIVVIVCYTKQKEKIRLRKMKDRLKKVNHRSSSS